MGKAIAVEGEVSASAGSVAFSADTDQAGSWSAGPVVETAYPNLSVGGTKAIWQAQCTFVYAGGTSGGGASPVPPAFETVTLTASSTIAQGGSMSVLVDGDVEESMHGNKLEVSAAGHWKTD